MTLVSFVVRLWPAIAKHAGHEPTGDAETNDDVWRRRWNGHAKRRNAGSCPEFWLRTVKRFLVELNTKMIASSFFYVQGGGGGYNGGGYRRLLNDAPRPGWRNGRRLLYGGYNGGGYQGEGEGMDEMPQMQQPQQMQMRMPGSRTGAGPNGQYKDGMMRNDYAKIEDPYHRRGLSYQGEKEGNLALLQLTEASFDIAEACRVHGKATIRKMLYEKGFVGSKPKSSRAKAADKQANYARDIADEKRNMGFDRPGGRRLLQTGQPYGREREQGTGVQSGYPRGGQFQGHRMQAGMDRGYYTHHGAMSDRQVVGPSGVEDDHRVRQRAESKLGEQTTEEIPEGASADHAPPPPPSTPDITKAENQDIEWLQNTTASVEETALLNATNATVHALKQLQAARLGMVAHEWRRDVGPRVKRLKMAAQMVPHTLKTLQRMFKVVGFNTPSLQKTFLKSYRMATENKQLKTQLRSRVEMLKTRNHFLWQGFTIPDSDGVFSPGSDLAKTFGAGNVTKLTVNARLSFRYGTYAVNARTRVDAGNESMKGLDPSKFNASTAKFAYTNNEMTPAEAMADAKMGNSLLGQGIGKGVEMGLKQIKFEWLRTREFSTVSFAANATVALPIFGQNMSNVSLPVAVQGEYQSGRRLWFTGKADHYVERKPVYVRIGGLRSLQYQQLGQEPGLGFAGVSGSAQSMMQLMTKIGKQHDLGSHSIVLFC